MSAQQTPRTVRERLDEGHRLSPAIRSQSFYSYDAARPAWMERPYGAGQDWARLAAALGRFDSSLSTYLDHRLDRRIEEGIALGNEAFHAPDNTDENGLRRSFQAWAEAHPDEAGKNPFIIKGYEQSRLRQLGMDYQKGLADFYSSSGVRNESDPARVDAAVNQFTGQWYKEHGLTEYPDKLMLAGNFSPSVAVGRTAVMQRHSNDLSAQNLARIKTAFQQESSKLLQGLTDPDQGGYNVSHPDERQRAAVRFGRDVAALAQKLADDGYPASDIPGVLLQALESEAARAAEEGDEDMLDLCQTMLGLDINGVTLGRLPDAAARMERLQESLSDREWKRLVRARQQREWRREDRMRATLGYALDLGRGRDDIDVERIAADHPDWSPEQINAAFDSASKFRAASYADPRYNPQAAGRLFEAHQRAILGLDGPEAVTELYSEFGPFADPVYAALLADSKTFTASRRDGLARIGAFVAGLYDDDLKQNPDRYIEILDSGEGQLAFSRQTRDAVNAAQAEFNVWYEASSKEGKVPTDAEIFLKLQDIQQRAQDEFRQRHRDEEAQAAAEAKRQEEEAKAEAQRRTNLQAQAVDNIHYLARTGGVVFDAPLKPRTQEILRSLLPDNIPMPETQAQVLDLLHTYYPAMTRRDFEALRLTTKGSVYDMGIM